MTIKQTKPDVFKSPGRSRDERLSSTSGVFASGERGKWMNPEHHEFANIFPLMTDDEINALAADIRENGLLEKIVLYDGKILDGRNRYMACLRAGVTPEFEQYQGDAPLQYVISLNLHRRHLSESQRAVIAERLANMTHGGDRKSGQAANWPLDISQAEAAEMLNVSERTIRRIRAVKEAQPELIEQIASGEITAGKAYKKVQQKAREHERAYLVATIPVGRYAVICADPPWQYSNSGFSQSAEAIYPTMPTKEICEMKDMVEGFCTPETVLFLWATNPLLPDAMQVMKAWGFEYKTNIIWIKNRAPGIGWFVKSYHEILLIGTKGNSPHPHVKPCSYFEAVVGAHSQKPAEAYAIIESMYSGAKLEMFSRQKREGWEAHGNEI